MTTTEKVLLAVVGYIIYRNLASSPAAASMIPHVDPLHPAGVPYSPAADTGPTGVSIINPNAVDYYAGAGMPSMPNPNPGNCPPGAWSAGLCTPPGWVPVQPFHPTTDPINWTAEPAPHLIVGPIPGTGTPGAMAGYWGMYP